MTSFGGAFKPFGVAIGFTFVALTAAFWIPSSDVAAVMAILAILLGVPISILLYRDGLRAVQAGGSRVSATTRILSLPLRMLGLVAVVAGFGTFLWLGYNVLIERQPQFTGVQTVKQLLLPLTLIGFGYRWVRHPLERSDGNEAA